MIWIVLPILIALMLQLGIELDWTSFTRIVRKPAAVVAGMVGQLVALPVIAFAIAWALHLPPVYFIGLVLIACCPGGSSSNVFSYLAKGDVALSVTLTALSSIITLFTIPLVMAWTTEYVSVQSDVAVELPAMKLLMQNVVLIFVPMFAGFLLKRTAPRVAAFIGKWLGKLAFPALMVLAATFFLQYTTEIIDNFAVLGLTDALLILAAMAAGVALARAFGLKLAQRRTIVIEVGMQNAAQAITIATSPLIFNNGEMAIPAIVYALLMNVILLTYLAAVRRRDRSVTASA